MIMETVKFLLLLLLCIFVGGMDNDDDDEMNLNHLDELLSLSELPLQKLLHVKRSFEAVNEDDSVMADQNGINSTSASDINPEALPLTASGGKSRRVNPLLHRPRFRTATRRGGKGGGGSGYGDGGGGGGWMQAMEKTKKADPSSIFQTSITALSFLAFGGYLLCLIVQAIRAKEAAAADGDFPEEGERLVILMKRPNRVRHRRSANKRKYRGSLKRLLPESQKRYIKEDNKANYNEETSGENEKCEMSCNGESYSATKLESRSSNISGEEQQNDYKLHYWPKANVDEMYRALIMIAEGYSTYHQVLHT